RTHTHTHYYRRWGGAVPRWSVGMAQQTWRRTHTNTVKHTDISRQTHTNTHTDTKAPRDTQKDTDRPTHIKQHRHTHTAVGLMLLMLELYSPTYTHSCGHYFSNIGAVLTLIHTQANTHTHRQTHTHTHTHPNTHTHTHTST